MANISSAMKDINEDDTEILVLTPSSLENNAKLNTAPNLFSLPPEILLSILPLAIPPYSLLDTSLSSGVNSAWCQTLRLMQSLVLVCRSWYDVGVIFLYENVCIRRYHQLKYLRRTLTSSRAKNLSLLVKSFTIQCYIPEEEGPHFRAHLKAVIGCCTSLSTFAYNARFIPPSPAMSIRFPAHITHFRLEGDFDFDKLFVILIQLEETLVSLHLTVWDDKFEQSVDTKKLWSQLYLPSLQSLSVEILINNNLGVLNTLGSHLVMPSLQRLTVGRYTSHIGDVDLYGCRDLQNAINVFLGLQGAQLRQLHINRVQFTPEALKQVLTFCPRLERIILHPSSFLRSYWTDSDVFLHPNLRWIDFTHHLRDVDMYHSSELSLSKANLPALERVRRFCNFSREMLKWLDEYPPNAGEMEEFVIDVFQHQLDCREGLIVWRFERDALEDNQCGFYSGSFRVWEDTNTDSDSDYEATSSDERDSSSEEDFEEWTTEDEDLTSEI